MGKGRALCRSPARPASARALPRRDCKYHYNPANPNTTPGTKFATGGNSINFHSTNLHSYWDSVTVTNAMTAAGQTTPHGFAQTFIASPPPGWQTGSFISGWAMKWANEVLPIAAQAHGKLTFHTTTHAWGAHCDDLPAYDIWAREQVSLEPEKGLAVRAGLRPTGRSHHRYSWT